MPRSSDTDPAAKRPCPRSIRSTCRSLVRFYNRTQRRVNIIWLNYEGEQQQGYLLLPGQFLDVNTFTTHPWIFRDADSGDKLIVSLKEVYHPEAAKRYPPQRNVVSVTIPVFTLKERCLQIVRSHISTEDTKFLELPKSLVEDILCRDTSITDFEDI